MRIISGKYRGKVIAPKNFKARPTTDYAKESLFNILNNIYEVESLKVLDLFAGTGSISFEFGSRGCENITAVEIAYRHASFIEKTAKSLDLSIKVVNNDCYKFLKFTPEKYDLIFADPPFDMKDIEKFPDIIFEHELLNNDGLFILEHSEVFSFTGHPCLVKHKNYGKVNFSFFEKKQ